MNETGGNEEEADYDVEELMVGELARLEINGSTYYVPKHLTPGLDA